MQLIGKALVTSDSITDLFELTQDTMHLFDNVRMKLTDQDDPKFQHLWRTAFHAGTTQRDPANWKRLPSIEARIIINVRSPSDLSCSQRFVPKTLPCLAVLTYPCLARRSRTMPTHRSDSSSWPPATRPAVWCRRSAASTSAAESLMASLPWECGCCAMRTKSSTTHTSQRHSSMPAMSCRIKPSSWGC